MFVFSFFLLIILRIRVKGFWLLQHSAPRGERGGSPLFILTKLQLVILTLLSALKFLVSASSKYNKNILNITHSYLREAPGIFVKIG